MVFHRCSTHTLVYILIDLFGMKHIILLISRFLLSLQLVLSTKHYEILPGSSAAAVTDRRNLRGLSKDCFRPGSETFSELKKLDDAEFGYD